MIDIAEAVVPVVKAVADAATPVVKTTSGESVAHGVWTLVGIIGPAVLAFATILVKFGPKWIENRDGRRKTDIERLDDRVGELESSLKAETAERVQAQMQLSYVVAAFGMISAELERQDPGNIVIRQARGMVAKATTKDGLNGDLIRALNMIPDTEMEGSVS